MRDRAEILSWLHLGGLHVTRAGEGSHRGLLRIVADGTREPIVRAEGKAGEASGMIPFIVGHGRTLEPPPGIGEGSGRDTVGAWPRKHPLGTRLGPNRHGRQW